MKKQLRLCFLSMVFFGFVFYAQAQQITVTRNDFADINDITIHAFDTVFAGVTPGDTGTSQTWNLDTLQIHVIDTSFFSTPGSTPYASSFPSANVAAYSSLDSSYFFVNANANSVNVVGYVAKNPYTGSPLELPFTPALTQITFPSTKGTTFNVNNAIAISTFYFDTTYASLTFDSIRITTTIDRSSVIDGWGTTKTPAGSFNSLRQKLTEFIDIAVDAYIVIPAFGWTPIAPLGQKDTVIHYYYIANGQDWPLAEIQTNYSGNVIGAEYLLSAVASVPELAAFGNKDLIIYPNPSSGEFNVALLNNKAALLKVFDIRGSEIEKIAIDNSSKSFSMSSFSEGIYLFQVLDKAGVLMSTGKLTIQK